MGGRAGSPKGLRASGKHSPCGALGGQGSSGGTGLLVVKEAVKGGWVRAGVEGCLGWSRRIGTL